MSASANRTAPVVEQTTTSSATARTAANPTPNRPTSRVLVPRLADARSDASDATPGASSGAPVFAATSTGLPSSPCARRSSSRPGVPARVAASAAFCASSTTTRSR
nr:hypothetical protein [Cellulomonas sp. FA1]